MPYLQIDLPGHYSAATKRTVAERIGELYAEIMQTRRSMVNVGFRELGPDNLYRCGEVLEAGIVVLCDIRRGRPAAQRLRLAEALRELCVASFGLSPDQIVVEFTQHAGDEMYRDGAWGREWNATESGSGSGSAPGGSVSRGVREIG
jgi:phenylpyruvate tautomerase PptA (4-oxalocrotonate tautomerase family)